MSFSNLVFICVTIGFIYVFFFEEGEITDEEYPVFKKALFEGCMFNRSFREVYKGKPIKITECNCSTDFYLKNLGNKDIKTIISYYEKWQFNYSEYKKLPIEELQKKLPRKPDNGPFLVDKEEVVLMASEYSAYIDMGFFGTSVINKKLNSYQVTEQCYGGHVFREVAVP